MCQNFVQKLIKHRRLDTVLNAASVVGYLFAAFKEYGIISYGTEYDADCAMAAASKGVEILSGGLEPHLPEGIDGFDAIALRK